jgi:ribosomal protein S27AE
MSAMLNCQVCGQTFEAQRSDAMYCGECKPKKSLERSRGYEHRQRTPCPQCGKSMVRGSAMCRECNNKAQPWRKVGEENSNWKGGKTMAGGYVYIRTKRISGGAGQAYQAEHILVWERTHGKPVPKGYVVHHYNGIKDDNSPGNLFAVPRKSHSPRLVVKPYQQRIIALEKEVRELRELLQPRLLG